jgi:hypothetical protein
MKRSLRQYEYPSDVEGEEENDFFIRNNEEESVVPLKSKKQIKKERKQQEEEKEKRIIEQNIMERFINSEYHDDDDDDDHNKNEEHTKKRNNDENLIIRPEQIPMSLHPEVNQERVNNINAFRSDLDQNIETVSNDLKKTIREVFKDTQTLEEEQDALKKDKYYLRFQAVPSERYSNQKKRIGEPQSVDDCFLCNFRSIPGTKSNYNTVVDAIKSMWYDNLTSENQEKTAESICSYINQKILPKYNHFLTMKIKTNQSSNKMPKPINVATVIDHYYRHIDDPAMDLFEQINENRQARITLSKKLYVLDTTYPEPEYQLNTNAWKYYREIIAQGIMLRKQKPDNYYFTNANSLNLFKNYTNTQSQQQQNYKPPNIVNDFL